MAKVMQDERRVIVEPWWGKGRIVATGLGAGLAWWVLAGLLQRYVVEPIACRNLSTATACVDSLGVAGSIAAIITALLGIYLLVRALQPRPIIIALASAVLLWDLGTLMSGLSWWATLLWSLALYTIAYVLFMLTARVRTVVLSIGVTLFVVVLIRLLLTA